MNQDSMEDQEQQANFWSFDHDQDALEIRRVEVPGARHSLRVIRDLIEDAATDTPLGDVGAAEFQMAVDEICANVVEHGYEEHEVEQEGTLIVETGRFNDRLEAIVTDRSAIRFIVSNPTVPKPSTFLQDQRKRGLGLDIVRHCVDKVEYQWLMPHGNQTRIIKFYGARRYQ